MPDPNIPTVVTQTDLTTLGMALTAIFYAFLRSIFDIKKWIQNRNGTNNPLHGDFIELKTKFDNLTEDFKEHKEDFKKVKRLVIQLTNKWRREYPEDNDFTIV